MSTSSSTQPQQNLKTGTVYTKIADFLDSNSLFDPEPVPIRSSNVVTNPYTKRKKRRYVDTLGDQLPPLLAQTVIGQCYHKLRKLEHELDVSISKRHSHIASQLQATNQRTHERSVTRVLRLHVENNIVDGDSNEWQCTLQFSVLDPRRMDRAINATDDALEYEYYQPLQSLISRMVVVLDAESLDTQETRPSRIEWNNAQWKHHRSTSSSSSSAADAAASNGFDITRKLRHDQDGNSVSMDIEIYLMHWFIPFEDAKEATTIQHSTHNQKNKPRTKASSVIYNHASALCKLSTPLASMLGFDLCSSSAVRYHTKSDVLQSLACYVKMHSLIRSDHSMAIDCDEALQRVLGAKTVYCGNLWKMLVLKKHILPPDPLRIRHQISASHNNNNNGGCSYDMLVKVPSLTAIKASRLIDTAHDLHNVSQPNGYAMTIDALNVQISDVLEEITEQSEEKRLYEEYAKDPVSTIDVIVSNQRENLQIIKEFAENAKVKRSNYFANPAVHTDIKRYLKKKQMQQK